MNIKHFIFIFILSFSTSIAQWVYYRPDLGPIVIEEVSDQESIQLIFSEIKKSLNNKSNHIINFLSTEYSTLEKKAEDLELDKIFFYEAFNEQILIDGDEALLTFRLKNIQNELILEERMILNQKGNAWFIKSSSFIVDFIIKFTSKHNYSESGSLKNVSDLFMSNTALVQRPAWWTSINTINESETKQHLNRILFEAPSDGKIVRISGSQDCISVVTDNVWRRIVYGSHDGQWVKSYGDNIGERELYWPKSITLNQYGNIYVLADFPRKIIKLQYNPSQQIISYIGEIDINDVVMQPVCIGVNDNYTEILNDDEIWVVDKYDNSICRLDFNGNLLGKYKRIVDAWTGEILYLNKPSKIAYFNNYNNLVIIDSDKQRLTSLYSIYYYQGDAIFGPFTSTLFNDNLNIKLNSVGRFRAGPLDGIWVGDEANSMIHIFGNEKGYLCSASSINGIDQWENPIAIVSTATSNSNGDYIGGMTLDKWDNTLGINTYYEGADLINLTTIMNLLPTGSPTTHITGITPTVCLITSDLYADNGTLIRNIVTNNVVGADETELATFTSGNLPNSIGKYRLHTSIVPYYNSIYGQFAMSPVVKDIYFSLPLTGTEISGPSVAKSGNLICLAAIITHGSGNFSYSWYKKPIGNTDWIQVPGNTYILNIAMGSTGTDYRCKIHDNFNNTEIYLYKTVNLMVPPIVASITQNPIPIYKGTYGYVYVNLSQGNGTINYNWFSTNQPNYIYINPSGSSCQITYLNVASAIGDGPTWDFGCTVTSPSFPGWSDTKRFSPSLNSDPNGCPTLAFERNGNLENENPLLISSLSNPDKDVADYYLINTPLTANYNKINLTIHEPQTEHTWFDNVSLLETRANPDETIVVNDEGQVINYKGVLPTRILLNGETDITQNLLEMDSLVVNLTAGDKLTISRNLVEGDGDVVVNGEEGVPISKRIPAMLMNVITQKQSVENDKEIITESIPFTNFFLRPNKSTISKKLRNLPTGTIEITVNKKLTLDYFVFVTDLRTARTRELTLVTAIHNLNGDIKSKITGIDQNYAEMYPTERIDLSFSTTTNSGNRAYILKTIGRYETDTTFLGKQNNLAKLNEPLIVPTENKLYDNYPNPFNPTTIIKYSLKDDGRVTVKIFNSLGEEVRTLVNEIRPAGNYEVEFNATELSSGVYIYRMQIGDFVSSKKMLLIK